MWSREVGLKQVEQGSRHPVENNSSISTGEGPLRLDLKRPSFKHGLFREQSGKSPGTERAIIVRSEVSQPTPTNSRKSAGMGTLPATPGKREDGSPTQALGQENGTTTWQDKLPASEREALELEGWGRLSETQVNVMRDSKRRAKEASDAALPRLRKRFAKLGFDEDQLNVLRHIAEKAPIVIHFNPDRRMGWFTNRTVLKAFLSDTHYRNKYETGVSGAWNRGRDQKERKLFGGLYHQSWGPPGWERPKYGALKGLPVGNTFFSIFGSCHFELQNDVRKRCTFGYGVTSDDLKQTPGTCEHFAHVLARCGKDQIRWLVAVSEKRSFAHWSEPHLAIEAQIHGPIQLKKDIREVRFRAFKPRKTQKRLQQLAEANGFAISSC
ncbi:hypothetical protein KFL_001820110 [Klebsormidium nitens]|uniref:Uncharacterized protein n=1 Tax=Klebsormidium nitens TaxID=105231 RepID=A0A1Y1I825_KLENI|nr:hypothetical protein KFL_001820110 [Klebsormidium nitens]|eukprot:GAQ84258.1 hypothetical protein KFL_001820110 [Klebsormidium nitens]